jgi:hypothetical protein
LDGDLRLKGSILDKMCAPKSIAAMHVVDVPCHAV